VNGWLIALIVVGGLLFVVAVHDVVQRRNAVWRNFPVIGHFRNFFETTGPEMRQYWISADNQEQPFNRDQRRWVDASSRQRDNHIGFGTEADLERSSNYLIIKPAVFPLPALAAAADDVPGAKVLGGPRGRVKAFRPASVINGSAMSFGSLSGPAIEAINRGAAIAGCWQNTGEGGLVRHHLHGGDLVFQMGTGYFGCRTPTGAFDLSRLVDLVAAAPVRAVEIKLSQGAKPGLGGILPAAKVTPEIAAIRGVEVGKDCVSPPAHSAFRDVSSLLDFVEMVAEATGLPVGIKSAVGETGFWSHLARQMEHGERGVDFITIDGGEGGTGAAPLVFADHVALPWKIGFARVYGAFAEAGVTRRVTFIGSGKLGFAEAALMAFAMGADMINVAREAMLSVGCIQSMKCHTGRCPVGVATQSVRFTRGLDPELKSVRFAAYVKALRHDLLALSHACGAAHPSLVTPDHLEIIDGHFHAARLRTVFDYEPGWAVPDPVECGQLEAFMATRNLTV